jgi:hypothetical protein
MYIMVRKIAEGTFKVIRFLLKRPDLIIRYSYSIDLQFIFNWTVQVGLSYNRLTIKYELVFSFVKINTRLNLFTVIRLLR